MVAGKQVKNRQPTAKNQTKYFKQFRMYTTPYKHFGKLTYEMWRACRLVVDTGIHAKAWTRKHVVDYMTSNTALSIHEIILEQGVTLPILEKRIISYIERIKNE